MNRSEAAILLGLAAAYDQRTVGDADVAAWADLLDRVSFADAQTAVKAHYSAKRERLMPVDVLDGVRKIRHERIERHEHALTPPRDLDPAGYRDWLVEARRQIADGTLTPADGPAAPIQLGRVFRTVPGEVESA